MRIVINSPPKSGNHWVQCLLKSIYDLEGLPETSPSRPDAFRTWADQGHFPDGRIFYQHIRFSKKWCDVIEAEPAHLVAIARNP